MIENIIDCARTSIHASSSFDAKQNCGPWTITWGIKIEIDIIEKIGLEIKDGIDNTWLESKCIMATVLNMCTLDDKSCQALLNRSVVQILHGYIRRRDSGGRSGMTSKRDYTVRSKNYSWNQPSPRFGLVWGASCDGTTYPEHVPPVGST